MPSDDDIETALRALESEGRITGWAVCKDVSVVPGVVLTPGEVAIALPPGELAAVAEELRARIGAQVRLVEGYAIGPNAQA